MPPATQNEALPREHFIARLLTAWAAEDYALSTDKYLEINEVLSRLPATASLESLKNFLAPLLTESPEKQHLFSRIFDETLHTCRWELAQHQEVLAKEKGRLRRHFLKMAIQRRWNSAVSLWGKLAWQIRLFCLLLASFSILFFLTFGYRKMVYSPEMPREEPLELFFFPVNLFEGSPAKYIITPISPDKGGIVGITRTSPDPPAFLQVDLQCIDGALIVQLSGRSRGREEQRFVMRFGNGSSLRIAMHFRVDSYRRRPNFQIPNSFLAYREPVAIPANPSVIKIDPAAPQPADKIALIALDTTNLLLDSMRFSNHPGRFNSGISKGWQFGWGYGYFSPQKWWAAGIFGLLLIGLGIWRRYKRQQFTLSPQAGAPYTWTMRVPVWGKVFMGEAFYRASVELRKRNLGEIRQLDMPRTIQATVKNAGMINVQYKYHFRNRDYLFLIDTVSAHNFRSKVFLLLAEELKALETSVEIFFYENDFRHCWNDRCRQGISLKDLHHKFPEYQLVIWGTGDACLDPDSETAAGWIQDLDIWRKAALMTPRPVHDWGKKESILAHRLRILPATPLGLSRLVETMESVEPPNYLLWSAVSDIRMQTIHLPGLDDREQLLAALDAELIIQVSGKKDDRMLQWLAACAIPPTLLWDWALYSGLLLEQPGEHFLTLDHLYQITRLPWFQEGKIPDEARVLLLEWLERQHPGMEIKFRSEWLKVLSLESNLPPVGSIAWQGHRIQVILNELLLNPQKRKKRELETELDELLLSNTVQDAFVVKYRESRKVSLDALLSDRFRKYVQVKRGNAWHWRDWTWQTGSMLAFLSAVYFVRYSEPVTWFHFDDNLSSVALSPDNQSFIATGIRGSVAVCRTDGAWVIGKKEERDKIIAADFSANGNTLITGSEDGFLKYWDISGAPLLAVAVDKDRLVTSYKFSPDFSKVLIGFYNGTARYWDIPTKHTELTLSLHQDAVKDVDMNAAGEFLTCSRDGSAAIWSPNGRILRTLNGHKSQVMTVSFAPDGSRIATGGKDEKAVIWSLDAKMPKKLKGHTGAVLDLQFSPDGRYLFTASEDKTIKMWSLDGALLRTFTGHTDFVTSIDVSSDGTMLLSGSLDQTARIWRLK